MSGVVDGQENPVANIYFAKYDEVQDYLSLTAHQYSALMLTIAENTWQELTESQRNAIQAAAEEPKWAVRAKDRGVRAPLPWADGDEGLQVNLVDTASFRAAMEPVYGEAEGLFGEEWVNRVLEKAAEVRRE
jgi:TRAP-type transport system periplasmic protein